MTELENVKIQLIDFQTSCTWKQKSVVLKNYNVSFWEIIIGHN